MIESIVPDFVKSFGNVSKDYVSGVIFVVGIGYGFVEESEGSVGPTASPETVLNVVV